MNAAPQPVPAPDQAVWERFAAPARPEEMLAAWFELICTDLAGAEVATLFLRSGQGGLVPAAIWPSGAPRARLEALRDLVTRARPDQSEMLVEVLPGGGRLLGYPVQTDGMLQAMIAWETSDSTRHATEQALRRLHWGSGWLHAMLAKQQQLGGDAIRGRMAAVLDVLAAIEDEPGLEATLRILADELRLRFDAGRVAVFLMGARRQRLRAVSGSVGPGGRAADMASLRQAAEEARLQLRSLLFPPPEAAGGGVEPIAILAAHRRHVRLAGVSTMLTVPMLLNGRVIGHLTVERMTASGEAGAAFTAADLLLAEALASAVAPVVDLRRREHRLISGRLRDMAGKGLRKLFGPRHPTLKLAALLLLGVGVALVLTPATLRLTAPAVVQGREQRALTAPFDGFIASAPARAGDRVRAGDVLAVLADEDLRLDRLRRESEVARLAQELRQYLAERDRPRLVQTEARLEAARAELALVEAMLDRVTLRAPFDAVVVEGDLSQRMGAPVQRGEVLFELAADAGYKAVLDIGEYDIGLVRDGMPGQLALAGVSAAPIPVTVTRIGPVSQVAGGANVFRAEAELPGDHPALRPGLQGVVRIAAGEGRLLSVLARPVIERLRYLYWRWTP